MSMEATTYIAFLRAINVGGRTVKMERLRELFSELGFGNVRSYIQTGNVFFDTADKDRAALTATIEQHLQKALGYEVATFLRTTPGLEESLALDPFKDVDVTPDTRLFVIFTSAPLQPDLDLPVRLPKGDFEIVRVTPGEAFVVLRLQDGRPGNTVAYIEKTFKVKATARFYGTTLKILEAAKRA